MLEIDLVDHARTHVGRQRAAFLSVREQLKHFRELFEFSEILSRLIDNDEFAIDC